MVCTGLLPAGGLGCATSWSGTPGGGAFGSANAGGEALAIGTPGDWFEADGCAPGSAASGELEMTGIVVTTRGPGLADCDCGSTGCSSWVTTFSPVPAVPAPV